MKAALLSLALFGADLTIQASDRVPRLNIEALCKARSADDKMMRLPEAQDVADCVRDETAAKDKLGTVWAATPGSVRIRCEAEAAVLGTLSYLDLLTCIQMADDVKWPSLAGGAGKKNRE